MYFYIISRLYQCYMFLPAKMYKTAAHAGKNPSKSVSGLSREKPSRVSAVDSSLSISLAQFIILIKT